MRPAKLLILALALLLVALFAVGCGGGGGGDTSATTAEETEATPSLTKQELIAQGDAICAEVNTAIGSVGTSAASTQSQITQVANLYTGMVESLKRLGTPKETAGYPEFIAAAEELAKIEGEAKLAAEREDTTALGEAATRAAPVLEEFEGVAGEYGFEECSEGPHAPSTSGPSSGVGGGEEGEEGGVEVAPEEAPLEEAAPEEVAPEEVAPEEGGGVGGSGEEPAPEEGGGGTSGGESGGIGPG
jgi:hypothetical protein